MSVAAPTNYKNLAAYHFVSLDRLPQRRKHIRTRGKELGLSGTILLSTEGINLFVAGPPTAVDTFLEELQRDPALGELKGKVSYSHSIPFRRLLVKIKREIIAFAPVTVDPVGQPAPRVTPRQLKQWLDEGRRLTLLDVRNEYEIRLGKFSNAISLGIDHFRDFAEQVVNLPQSLQDQTIVTYCTGGIRCEKAGPYLQQMGFRDIYQLDGGILQYFEDCGSAHYEGECFVFDHRVAVDPQLRETQTTLCFACQSPVSSEDQLSPAYVVGKSCPHCFRSTDETMRRSIEKHQAQLRALISPLPGSVPYENRRPILISPAHAGRPLLSVVMELYPQVPESEWREAIAAGRLQRGTVPITLDTPVIAGERIQNVFPGTIEPAVNADISILYEDAYLIAVNKPAPLPMHACGRYHRNTLLYLLNEVFHPHVLRVAHRLDSNTTGIVILSRTRAAAGQIQPQFARGEVEKRYLVQVDGHPPLDTFRCDAAISEQALRSGARQIDAQGLASCTDFRVIQRLPDNTSLLEARPLTGRTNQIRLHLAHLGWPVCGDPTYGQSLADDAMPTLPIDAPALRLHAWKLAFRHPLHGKPISFTTAMPTWWPASVDVLP